MSPGLVGMLFNLNGLGGVALKILLLDGHFEISTVLYFSKIVWDKSIRFLKMYVNWNFMVTWSITEKYMMGEWEKKRCIGWYYVL